MTTGRPRMDNPKTVQFNFRLTENESLDLDRLVAARGRQTAAQLIRDLIQQEVHALDQDDTEQAIFLAEDPNIELRHEILRAYHRTLDLLGGAMPTNS